MEKLSHEGYAHHLREQDTRLLIHVMRIMRIITEDTLLEIKYQYDELLSQLAGKTVDTANLKKKFEFELEHHRKLLQHVDHNFGQTRRQVISASYSNLQLAREHRREYSIKCGNFQARFSAYRLEEKRKFCKDLIDRVRAINMIILANC